MNNDVAVENGIELVAREFRYAGHDGSVEGWDFVTGGCRETPHLGKVSHPIFGLAQPLAPSPASHLST